MPTTYTENWDADCTPPALPAVWNAGASYATVSGTTNGVTPTSGSQMLGANTGNLYVLSTYNAATDANSGNVVVSSKFNWASLGTHKSRAGVCARGSASTLDYSSTTYLIGHLDQQLSVVQIKEVVNGVETLIAGLTVLGALSTLVWYQLKLSLNGTAMTLTLQRLSDSFWLNNGGNWQAGQATAISTTSAVLNGVAGFAGMIIGNDFGSQSLYTDDWSISPFVATATHTLGTRRYHAGEPRRRGVLIRY